MKSTSVIKIFVIAVLFVGVSSSVSAQDASFEETTSWMKGKLEQFKYSSHKDYGGSNRWNFTDKYSYKILSSGDCSIKLEETMRHVTAQSHSRNDYTRTKVYEFSFGDIKSITFKDGNEGSPGFLIKTYNDLKKIMINPDGSTSVTNELMIYAEDLGELDGQSDRFLKAFNHAMSLCGAKEEKF